LVARQDPIPLVEAFISPLELKTSKPDHSAGISHRSQVLLYTLLMSDYFDTDVKYGLLLYLKSDSLTAFHSSSAELRGIVKRRNELAIDLVRGLLPPMLDNPECKECQICDFKGACSLFHISEFASLNDVNDDELNGKLPKHFPKFNLTNERLSFFANWNAVLDLEKNSVGSYRKEMWEISSSARESIGRCLSTMVLQAEIKGLNGGHSYTFQKKKSKTTTKRPVNLLDLHFVEGDFVTIGTEDGVYGLGSGTISSITETNVTIDCEQPLKNPPMWKPYQPHNEQTLTFQGLFEVPNAIRHFAVKYNDDSRQV